MSLSMTREKPTLEALPLLPRGGRPPWGAAHHNRERGLERRLDIERRRIEHDGVLGRHQGRRGAVFVALVAPDDVGEHGGVFGRLALAFELQSPARRPRVNAGRDEYFWARLGTNHGADVAAVEDGAAGAAREAALEFDEGHADLGNSGDNRRRFRHLAAAQQIFVETGE